MAQLKYIVIHCLSTPKGRYISADTILTWHKGPEDQPDGRVKYLGNYYSGRRELPNDMIAGIPIIKLFGRGWDRPGYRSIINPDGTEEILVEVDNDNWITNNEMTWGAAGINAESIHIALAGGWDGNKRSGMFYFFDIFTDEQFIKLEFVLKELLYHHPQAKVMGHYQVPNANKTCPNFDVPYILSLMAIPKENIYQ